MTDSMTRGISSGSFIALLLFAGLLLGTASAQEPLFYDSCFADSEDAAGPAAGACDSRVNSWFSTNTVYPHWIVGNFTTTVCVSAVGVWWAQIADADGDAPGSGRVEVWDATEANWATVAEIPAPTATTDRELLVIEFAPVATNATRLYGETARAGGTAIMGIMEMAASGVIGTCPAAAAAAEDLTFFWVLIFAMVFLTGLGLVLDELGSLFLFLAGFDGVVIAYTAYELFANPILSAILGGIGTFLILAGIADVIDWRRKPG